MPEFPADALFEGRHKFGQTMQIDTGLSMAVNLTTKPLYMSEGG
jgi:hypothetical protein